MQSFYSTWLFGSEIHQALKKAELEMREKVKREHDGHDLPTYWGAFGGSVACRVADPQAARMISIEKSIHSSPQCRVGGWYTLCLCSEEIF